MEGKEMKNKQMNIEHVQVCAYLDCFVKESLMMLLYM